MVAPKTPLALALAAVACAAGGFALGYAMGRSAGGAGGDGAEPAASGEEPAAEVAQKDAKDAGEKKPAQGRPAQGRPAQRPRRPQVTVEALVEDLKSPDKNKRMAACAALARRKDAAAMKPLLDVLHKDADTDVRYQCAMALSGYGERVVPELVQALASANADVRYKAGNALEKVQPASAAVSGLASALKADSAAARQHAVFLVGQIGTREAVPLLVGALSDADKGVVAKAEEGLLRAAEKHRAALKAAAGDAKLPAAARAKLEAILLKGEKPSGSPPASEENKERDAGRVGAVSGA